MASTYALVDGNNFYVSCERAFQPRLKGLPVIVLSNNDGCAIARSNEAKALGIAMAEPWPHIRKRLAGAGVVALSANFTLYGDMSHRLMAIAAGLGPAQEIYSIDECFISLDGVPGNLVARSRALCERTEQWIGVPCGVGIGPTKTLAKLANHVAKEAARGQGGYPGDLAQVCDLGRLPASDLDAVLAATGVRDVWGIGPQLARQLQAEGIHDVLQLARMDAAVARRRWSVVVERTVRELQGQPCIGLEEVAPPHKEVSTTRAFGDPVTTLAPVAEAVSEYASRAAYKLRQQHSVAGQLLVFIHTNPFRAWERQYARSVTVPLRRPTADTTPLVQAALRGLKQIWQPGYPIHKAGVILMDLRDASVVQGELALEDEAAGIRPGLAAVVDRINDRYGRGTLQVASAGLGGEKRSWTMKQQWRSAHYTTDWDQLPEARA